MNKIFLTSSLIILSFFIWYFYKTFEVEKKIKKLENKKYYIDIKKNKNKLKIINPNKNVVIFVWEQKMFNDFEIKETLKN